MYKMIIGRHCPVEIPNFFIGAIEKTVQHGANSLQIFLGSPFSYSRRFICDKEVLDFKRALKKAEIKIENVIVHGSYISNLANITNPEIIDSSMKLLKKEVEIMKKLDLELLVIHPGSSIDPERKKESIELLAKNLNSILKEDDSNVRIALETMCGKKGQIGKKFEEIREVLEKIIKKKKVGVCWDTCHLYSAGYDLVNGLEDVIREFERIIGLDKLWVIHINDSKYELGEQKDRHENVGLGKIGYSALKKIVQHPKFDGIIKILETPIRKNKDTNFEWEEISKLKKY